jgi:hypothetical protein
MAAKSRGAKTLDDESSDGSETKDPGNREGDHFDGR